MTKYTFINKKTKKQWTEIMTIAEMEELTKKKHISQVIMPLNIVRATGSIKTDSGWKENLSRIAEAHPNTALGRSLNKKTTKELKTREVLKKHKVIK